MPTLLPLPPAAIGRPAARSCILTSTRPLPPFCFLELHLTPQQLQAAAQRLFAAPECGRVLRVKGFAPAPAGGWLELNATAAGCTLAPIPQGQEVVIVIGEALDKAAIEANLKGEVKGSFPP